MAMRLFQLPLQQLLMLLQLALQPSVSTLFDPRLTHVRTIVDDPNGHVRDCAPPLQDNSTGYWHMWCNWVSISAPSQSCWNCTVRHYYLNTSNLVDSSAVWQDRGVAVAASEPWDSAGAWAPGVIEEGGVWSLFYCTTSLAAKNANLGGECIGLAVSHSGPFGPFVKQRQPVACNNNSGSVQRKLLDNVRPWVIRDTRVLKMRMSDKGDAHELPYLWYHPGAKAHRDDEAWSLPFLPNKTGSPFVRGHNGHFENCEVMRGTQPTDHRIHMVCFDNRGCPADGVCNPHFVLDPGSHFFQYVSHVNLSGTATPCRIGYPYNEGTFHHCEPAPIYESGRPGDEATVNYMVSFWGDQIDGTIRGNRLKVHLMKLSWVAHSARPPQPSPPPPPPLPPPPPSKSAPVSVGSSPQLFFDMELVAESRNLTIQLHRPTPVANDEKQQHKLVISDRPWEDIRIWAYNSLVDNGTHILLYYYVISTGDPLHPAPPGDTQTYTCLAVSSDKGRTFTKPDLGVVSWNGSSSNNIVWPPEPVFGTSGHETGTVFIDMKSGVLPDAKYKMVCSWKGAAWSLQSPDGINWRPMASSPAYTGSDTGQVAFFSASDNAYLAYRRTRGPPALGRQCQSCAGDPVVCNVGQPQSRQVALCASESLAHFDECSQGTTVFSFDEHDDPCVDMYTSSAVVYEGHTLIFPSVFRHFPSPPEWCCNNDGVWDVRIASSRNGRNFSYIGGDRAPFLYRGRGEDPASNTNASQQPPCSEVGGTNRWDSSLVSIVRGLIPDDEDGTVRMLYWGDVVRHGHHTVPCKSTGFAAVEVRKHGFASLNSPAEWDSGAEFVTRPLRVKGLTLWLNVRTANGATVAAELQNGTEAYNESVPLSGFELENSVPMSGNAVSRKMLWACNATDSDRMPTTKDEQVVRLRLVMRGHVELYSFHFS